MDQRAIRHWWRSYKNSQWGALIDAYIIIYTSRFIPLWAAGCTYGPVILIRPEYRNDKGLLEHERVHVKQWIRTLGLHGYLYLFIKSYRLKAEVEAYKEQLKHYADDRTLLFAGFIAGRYELDVSVIEAVELLRAQ